MQLLQGKTICERECIPAYCFETYFPKKMKLTVVFVFRLRVRLYTDSGFSTTGPVQFQTDGTYVFHYILKSSWFGFYKAN